MFASIASALAPMAYSALGDILKSGISTIGGALLREGSNVASNLMRSGFNRLNDVVEGKKDIRQAYNAFKEEGSAIAPGFKQYASEQLVQGLRGMGTQALNYGYSQAQQELKRRLQPLEYTAVNTRPRKIPRIDYNQQYSAPRGGWANTQPRQYTRNRPQQRQRPRQYMEEEEY